MRQTGNISPEFDRVQRIGGIVGIAGCLVLAGGAVLSAQEFLQSYLYAYVLWLGIVMGCFGVFMLHHLVSGGWGFVTQRITEAGMRTLPLMAILFIPILLGITDLYPWAGPKGVETGSGAHVWLPYLNTGFFIIRAILYFIWWIAGAFLLTRWSRQQDSTADPALTRKIRLLSAPGLVFYVITMTFASVDWVMSLEPGWFSTIYGFLIVVSQVLTALCFVIIVLRYLSERPPLAGVVTERHVHHLGNLVLTFVILWAYMAYSQFLITWSGNLPDETSWYVRRLAPGWSSLGLFVVVVHFFVPLVILLFRRVKRSIRSLAWVAWGLIIMRLVDTFWLVTPAFSPAGLRIRVLDVVAPLALGGLWLWYFVHQLKQTSLLPLHDPRFEAMLEPAEA